MNVSARSVGRTVLVRIDGAGCSHDVLDYLHARRLGYLVGFTLPDTTPELLDHIPDSAWTEAHDAEGAVREGALVAELTGLLDLSGWPPGMRVIARKDRPHAGAQLRITDVNGWRVTAFATNTPAGGPGSQLPDLEYLSAEASRRSDALKAMGKAKVTPELAQLPGFHPIVCTMDEFQFLFIHPRAKELVPQLLRRIRSTNIRLVLATQGIDGTIIEHSFPGLFRKRLALQLTTGSENTTMLGNGAVRQGFDAVAIERAGEAILAGEEGGLRRLQVFEMTEELQESITERALALRGGVAEKLPLPSRESLESEPTAPIDDVSHRSRNLLADMYSLRREDESGIWFKELVPRLEAFDGAYAGVQLENVKAALAGIGVHPRPKGVTKKIKPGDDKRTNAPGYHFELDIKPALGGEE